MPTPRPLLLCILDGWGYREEEQDNAIATAHTPCWDRLWKNYPHTMLHTSGLAVGLPEGQMGNSEVGHMNIGSGRVVMQDLPRIDQAIADGTLAAHPQLKATIAALKASGNIFHVMGLASPGGVHAHSDHILALAKIISAHDVPVRLHLFLDGRDTPPSSAREYVAQIEKQIASLNNVKIATVSGRYYAMDRDNRFDRVERAYRAIVSADAARFDSADQAIAESYKNKVTDEFVLPAVIGEYRGIQKNDALLMANFRADRARQLLTAFCDPAFNGFSRKHIPEFSDVIGMVEYSSALNAFVKTLFLPETLSKIFGEIISERGLTQLRIAETEKYAHVTFFFNGGREENFKGEERILVPSPRVATYDMQPEMSAITVTDKLVEAIESDRFDVIVANYANTDMVGHTGDLKAAQKAVETIDQCLARLADALHKKNGAMLITADHGNAECMRDEYTGEPHTAHTTGPVPCLLVGEKVKSLTLRPGRLADVAPTLLDILSIPQPLEMTGESLICR